MPELGEYVAALGVDRISNTFPARHLLVAVEPRCTVVAPPGRRDRRRFREDQPAIGRTLAVVFDYQIARNSTRPVGSEPAHRRHHDAVLESDRPDLHGRKQLILSMRNHCYCPCDLDCAGNDGRVGIRFRTSPGTHASVVSWNLL